MVHSEEAPSAPGGENPGGENSAEWGGKGEVGKGWRVRHAGHPPSSPLQSPPRILRNPQGQNRTPSSRGLPPPPELPTPSPPGPLFQAPLSPKHPPPPQP